MEHNRKEPQEYLYKTMEMMEIQKGGVTFLVDLVYPHHRDGQPEKPPAAPDRSGYGAAGEGEGITIPFSLSCGMIFLPYDRFPLLERSGNMQGNQTEKYTLLYGRLSNEDSREGTTLSIQRRKCCGTMRQSRAFAIPCFCMTTAFPGQRPTAPASRGCLP